MAKARTNSRVTRESRALDPVDPKIPGHSTHRCCGSRACTPTLPAASLSEVTVPRALLGPAMRVGG